MANPHPLNVGKRVRFAQPVGGLVTLGPGETVWWHAPSRIVPFVLEWLYVRNDWTPPAPSIWWRSRPLRWFMRRVLKRLPPLVLVPLEFKLRIDNRILAAGGYQQDVGREIAGEPMFLNGGAFADLGLVIERHAALELALTNLSDRPIHVAATVGGWSIS